MLYKEWYKEDLEKISIILNNKKVIDNFIYKLKNDLNFNNFLLTLAEDYKNRTENNVNEFYFYNNIETTYKILNHILEATKFLGKKSTIEQIKSNFFLPDGRGSIILRYLGYFPIIELIYKQLKYEKYISKYISLNKIEDTEHTKMYEEDNIAQLYNKNSLFYTEFIDLEGYLFVDKEKQKIYLEQKVIDYEQNIKYQLQLEIDILIDYISKHNNDKNFLMLMGETYWEKIIDNQQTMETKWGEVFKVIFDNININKD